jgi:hypothetical protein
VSPSVALHSAARSRNRSTEARRAARLEKLDRERLIVDYLNRGVSVPEIASRVGVTEKRMRALVKEILARRMPSAPAEYVALQVSRLNEALLVAYSAMAPDNLKAVALVVRIVRELDRYHGFAADGRRAPSNPRPVEEASDPPALFPSSLAGEGGAKRRTSSSARRAAPPDIGLEKAPQAAEKTDSMPGIGTGAAVPDEPNLSRPVEPDHNPEALYDPPRMAPQALENAKFVPGHRCAAEPPSPSADLPATSASPPDAPQNGHFQAASQPPEKAAPLPEDGRRRSPRTPPRERRRGTAPVLAAGRRRR